MLPLHGQLRAGIKPGPRNSLERMNSYVQFFVGLAIGIVVCVPSLFRQHSRLEFAARCCSILTRQLSPDENTRLQLAKVAIAQAEDELEEESA